MPAPVQTFRSPNFYDREIDQSGAAPQGPVGVPAGIIGTANRGPAFVPVTVGNFDQFVATFGDLDPKRFGPYAANQFLANRQALTFLRLLGAGANASGTDIARAQETGRVLNAGLKFNGDNARVGLSSSYAGITDGCVQFLVAQHLKQVDEAYGQADFTDNDSFKGSVVNLVRGVVMMANTARLMVASLDYSLVPVNNTSSINAISDMGVADANGHFKLIISTSLGNAFYNNDGNPGVHVLTASLNPDDPNYFAKILNTNPDNFASTQHLLYSDFAVDDEIATVDGQNVGVVSGSLNHSLVSQDSSYTGAPYNDNISWRATFGAFDARYSTPSTTNFISQPFGQTEFDLFRVEALDDGAYANNLYKVSIANLAASTNPASPYGTFSLQIRSFDDTDISPNVLEQFNNLTLNPNDPNGSYIAQSVGDRKVTFNFDSTDPNERRIVTSGKYQNNSQLVRVVMNDQVDRGLIPAHALPFGFRGAAVLKTNDTLTDNGLNVGSIVRLTGNLTGSAVSMSGSIVPPVPFRSKVTKGQRPTAGQWFGQPGSNEISIPLFYWGTKFERNDIPLDPNLETLPNNLLNSLTSFQGISLLDTLVTGSGADALNDNKFTLSKVAFSNNFSNVYSAATGLLTLTASVDTTMREAAYFRNGKVDTTTYTINDGVLGPRVTFATLLTKGTPAQFNRFGTYLKFSTFMGGGFDGVNFLDPDARRMNDQSTSFDSGYGTGGALAGFVPNGFATNQNGSGQSNATVASYVSAINIMTDPMQVNHNLLAIPGIRESFITDYASTAVKTYGLAYYVMDLAQYDETGERIYDASTGSNGTSIRPDVGQTAQALNTRAIDNNYVGTYFPDVFINDTTNNRRVMVPSSIAALGALSFNDRVGYPWFAPAGFNRAALDFVTNVQVRLTSADRDTLYDSRINPIATFPRQGFVIFGQKTLQIKSSALDRVNVRRLLLEVKRIIINIALALEFEQNTPDVWSKFVSQAALQLGLIQTQAGIEAFQVTMNETNNSATDIDQNKVNGRIVVVPTRVIEFIAIDFIITNSGVSFT
jgi:hypothetical protein